MNRWYQNIHGINETAWLLQYDRKIQVNDIGAKTHQMKAILERNNYMPDFLAYGGNGWFVAVYKLTQSEILNSGGSPVESIKASYAELSFVLQVRGGQREDGHIRIRFQADEQVLEEESF